MCPRPDVAARFYGELLGWSFDDASAGPPIATLEGREVASLDRADGPAAWATYVAVDDADASAAAVADAGGTVVDVPRDVGTDGRAATCADPTGATFRLWQPRGRAGAQLVNAPGTWNFSHLRTTDAERARAFYAAVFGWEYDADPGGFGASIRVPGYGDHLAATVDPDIHVRQASAPPGFADVIGGMQPAGPGEDPHWHVTFGVADRDGTLALAGRLGGAVVSTIETPWTRLADLRDPGGAEFTVSQFTPPA